MTDTQELDIELSKITDINVLRNIYKELLLENCDLERYIKEESEKVLPKDLRAGAYLCQIGSRIRILNLCQYIEKLQKKNLEVVENCVCKREDYK